MQEIIKKINDKLKDSGWYDELRIFLESSDFSDIIGELKRKVEVDKQRFCPGLSSAFKFMELLPVSKIKAVILIDHISNRLDVANGIPLSNPHADDSTLIYFLRSIDTKLHDSKKWLEQGVLLLPLSLTCRIDGKAHKKLWIPFIMRMIETINKKHPNIPWMLIGNDTWKYEEDIVSDHIRKMELKIPMKDTTWSQWVNEVLINQSKAVIKW